MKFYKFITFENKTSANTGRCLRRLIDVVRLHYRLYLDNCGSFKDGIFKKFLRKFWIVRHSLSHIYHGIIGLNIQLQRLRDMHGR